MEKREVNQLWNPNEEEKGPLRHPNPTPPSTQIFPSPRITPPPHSQSTQPADTSILEKTNLRVDAKEWFPSSFCPAVTSPVPHSAQNRLKNIKISQESEINTQPGEYYDTSQINYEQQVILDASKLTEIVKSLTYDPGQFDNAVETFTAVVSPYFEDVFVMSDVAEMIFEQALCEPSFRYNAARLCSVIDEHCSLFRPHLHLLCEKALQENPNKQGLTLLIAELYMQLHYENIYGRSLLTAIKNLIISKNPDDIKCICQTLKLAGNSLVLYNTKALDDVILELEAIKKAESMPLLNGLLDSVFELRRSQWGQTPVTPIDSHTPEQNGYTSSSSEDGIVVYGPDGQEITTEEREFLRANFEDPNDYLGDESSDPDDLYDPEPEMDEEIQAAFREFVKLSKR